MQGAIEARRERIRERTGGSLRVATARGVMINGVFNIALQGLSFLRGFLVAIFLAPSDYGLWSLIVVAYTTLGILKTVGIGEKFVQQDEPDQELAFQKAFTLEAMLTGGFWIFLMAATPLVALIYGEPRMIPVGLVALAAMPGGILETPIWGYVREMDFKRQRILASVDPLATMAVTIALAAGGFGYWCFAIGNVAGSWIGAAVILRHSPYRLRLRYDGGTAREYIRFSTPLLFSNLSSLVLMQSVTLLARSSAGLAGVGALSLASSVRTYTAFADQIISSAMYPAVCAVKDRVDLMFESFVKSNRLALMWGFPAGVGVTLFAPDLIAYVLGHRWDSAVFLLQMVGLMSAIGHIAFNWDDYVRATGDTRPVMKYAWIGLIGWAIGPIPLLATRGLHDYAIGLFVVQAVNFAVRGYFMRKMFPGFAMVRHGLRAIAPTVPAVLVVLGLRMVEPTTRSFGVAAAELVTYVGVTAIATWMTERALLREAVGYLRRMRARPARLAT